MAKPQILILGGTSEARQLAGIIVQEYGADYQIVTSLSGLTKKPTEIPGETRIGGFGGVEGLSQYLNGNKVILLLDATHPFAKNMPSNAVAAAKNTDVKLRRLLRPAWQKTTEDIWIEAESLTKAAEILPRLGQHALLTVGSQDLASFRDVKGLKMTARMIEEPPEENLPENCDILLNRPPYHLNEEEALFSRLGIDILVTKNSGGKATVAKLEAARKQGIQTLMIQRPPQKAQHCFDTIKDLTDQIKKDLT